MSKGRPTKKPILPEMVDKSKSKKDIRGQLYPTEWKILKEKIDERGYGSIAEWVENQAEKVIKDRDVRDRLNEVEKRKKLVKDKMDNLHEEEEKLKQMLEDRQEKVEEKIYQIEDKLKLMASDLKKRLKREYLIEDLIPEETGLKVIDIKRGKEIVKEKYDEHIADGQYKKEDFAEAVIHELNSEELLEEKK